MELRKAARAREPQGPSPQEGGEEAYWGWDLSSLGRPHGSLFWMFHWPPEFVLAAAVTNYQKLRGLKRHIFIISHSGGRSPKIKELCFHFWRL